MNKLNRDKRIKDAEVWLERDSRHFRWLLRVHYADSPENDMALVVTEPDLREIVQGFAERERGT